MNITKTYNPKQGNVKVRFSRGDLVFAKRKNYPYWPAKVEHVVSAERFNAKYSVRFFATGDRAVCKEYHLCDYAIMKDSFQKYRKYPGYQQALDEMEEAASTMEQGSKAGEDMGKAKVVLQRLEESTEPEVRAYFDRLKLIVSEAEVEVALLQKRRKQFAIISEESELADQPQENSPLQPEMNPSASRDSMKRQSDVLSQEGEEMHRESGRVKKSKNEEEVSEGTCSYRN